MKINLKKFNRNSKLIVGTIALLLIVVTLMGHHIYKAENIIQDQQERLETQQGHLERTKQLIGREKMFKYIYQVDNKGVPLWGYDKEGNQIYKPVGTEIKEVQSND